METGLWEARTYCQTFAAPRHWHSIWMLPSTIELTYENMVEACKIEPFEDSTPLAPHTHPLVSVPPSPCFTKTRTTQAAAAARDEQNASLLLHLADESPRRMQRDPPSPPKIQPTIRSPLRARGRRVPMSTVVQAMVESNLQLLSYGHKYWAAFEDVEIEFSVSKRKRYDES
jgi:hypothetical protein